MLKVHLTKSTKMDDYFGLIFQAVKADKDSSRIVSFIRRLLQMTFINESSFAAASLLVINEIFKIKKDVKYQIFTFAKQEETAKPALVANV